MQINRAFFDANQIFIYYLQCRFSSIIHYHGNKRQINSLKIANCTKQKFEAAQISCIHMECACVLSWKASTNPCLENSTSMKQYLI